MWDIFFCTLRLICEMMKLLCSCVVVVVVYFSFSLCIIKHILWASEFWSEKRVLCCSMCIILCAFLSLNATHKRRRKWAHPDPLVFQYFPRCYCVTLKLVHSFSSPLWVFPFLSFLWCCLSIDFNFTRFSMTIEWMGHWKSHTKEKTTKKVI